MHNSVEILIDDRGVATVTLNRPEVHNAFDDSTIAQLSDAFTELDQNDSVRIVILAAAGKAFSAGGDLNWMKRMAGYTHAENLADAEKLAAMLQALNFMCKPTIARVQGAAFGGAVGLVSCCDFAIGTDRASFSLSEVKIGLAPATIAPYVVAAIGQRACRRYFQTGERFNAQTALHLGLLSEVVTEEQLDIAITALLDTLLANSPQGQAASKQLVFEVANKAIDAHLIKHTTTVIAGLRVSEEGQEGLSAFLEKRRPNWAELRPDRN